MGGDPAFPSGGGVHGDLREACGSSQRRGRALCADGVRRDASVVPVCHIAGGGFQQSREQCEPHQQGVLSSVDRAVCIVGGISD